MTSYKFRAFVSTNWIIACGLNKRTTARIGLMNDSSSHPSGGREVQLEWVLRLVCFRRKFGRACTWRIFVGLVCCVDVFTVCRCYHVPKVRSWSAKKRGAFVLNNIIYICNPVYLYLYRIFVSFTFEISRAKRMGSSTYDGLLPHTEAGHTPLAVNAPVVSSTSKAYIP